MGRVNPIAQRLRTLVNWPSNVRHPFITEYIKHIFQKQYIGEPAIRASANRIVINLTVYSENDTALKHPKAKEGIKINFKNYQLENSLGRLETRISNLSNPSTQHFFYEPLMKHSARSPLAAVQGGSYNKDVLKALQIYKDHDITLNINVIRNPLLNAKILAEVVARELKSGKNLALIYKDLVNNMHE
ncbi:hypothetical protein HK096_004028 [Nowakowskiella sp. JEL0078]|nr:hypothetical protein HK096_004028 [Nowakowskiella sp. JEL0078]